MGDDGHEEALGNEILGVDVPLLFANPELLGVLDEFVGDLLGPPERELLLNRRKGFGRLFTKIDRRCLEWEPKLDLDGREFESTLLYRLRVGLEHYLWEI